MKFVIQNTGDSNLVVQFKAPVTGEADPQALIQEVKVKRGVYQTIEASGGILIKEVGEDGLVKSEDVFFGD